ncbi:hypothetical protein, partial [Bradyrhizobium japonicum]|uniref:hypothetical protein n=2 Tax=Bradyrhizobium TaxID=374 RepID=UPI001AEC8F4B
APDSQQESSPLSGRKSTQATVRICGASSAGDLAVSSIVHFRHLLKVALSSIGPRKVAKAVTLPERM